MLHAQGGDLFEFFEEEARAVHTITASRSPYGLRDAPATVHVIDRADLAAYGSLHLWEALRGLPGVDVMTARTAQGLVSIRGLSKVNNNRTLVLLDGRRALDGYSESLNWESLPVPLEEIDRIEVVEGPVSALYGGNAVTGVINIITRQPADGLQATVAAGDRETLRGSVHSGRAGRDRLDLTASAELSSENRFEDADRSASEVLRGRALARYRLGTGGMVSLSGGLSDLRTDVTTGGLGNTYEDGTRGFLRSDYIHGPHQLRLSGAAGSTLLRSFAVGSDARVDYTTVEGQAQTRLSLSRRSALVLGGEFRQDGIDAAIAEAAHDLFAVFFDHRFQAWPSLSLWTSGRFDRHPHAGTEFSPRLTAVVEPHPAHILRLSTGTAFRHPTLLENHVLLTGAVDVRVLDPTGQVDTVEFVVRGNPNLRPERLFFAEVAHSGRFGGRLSSQVSLFHYRLRDVYAAGEPQTAFPRSGVVYTGFSLVNSGTTRAWGGELALEGRVARGLTVKGSYSYQGLSGGIDDQATQGGTPHHKASAFARCIRGDLVADAAVHRVAQVRWNTNRLVGFVEPYASTGPYTLVDLSLRYRFHGVLEGLETQVVLLNLLDSDHFEVLPRLGPFVSGQGGETVGSRRALRLAYRL